MTVEELQELQPDTQIANGQSAQIRLNEKELKDLKDVNDELIAVEEVSVQEGQVLMNLFDNDDFKAFIDMYTTKEAERLSDAITSTSSISSTMIVTLQEMQVSIRHFKLFLLAKQNESHGAELRLADRKRDAVKIDNGDVFKEVEVE